MVKWIDIFVGEIEGVVEILCEWVLFVSFGSEGMGVEVFLLGVELSFIFFLEENINGIFSKEFSEKIFF